MIYIFLTNIFLKDDNVNDMWEFPFVYLFLKTFSDVTNFKMPYIEVCK